MTQQNKPDHEKKKNVKKKNGEKEKWQKEKRTSEYKDKKNENEALPSTGALKNIMQQDRRGRKGGNCQRSTTRAAEEERIITPDASWMHE